MIAGRAELLRQVRRFFDDRGFFEVQPPVLARDCVVDAYLDPIAVPAEELGTSDPNRPRHYFLQTSPESAMKRMLAAGAPSIYSLGPVFRSGEFGQYHNIEFTMLEWYHRDAQVDHEIRLLGELACHTLACDEVRVVRYRELFRRHLSLDPISCDLADLARRVTRQDAELAQKLGADRDSLLDVLFSSVIQPELTGPAAWIVRDYPLSQAALAKQSTDDPECAQRFELFFDGVEMANGYDELLDADELIRRAEANNVKRQQSGRRILEIETTLVAAMRRGLPECCGVALGFDRLLMKRMGVPQIRDVMPLPSDVV